MTFSQNSTIAINTHVKMEHVWMGTILTLAPVLMATKGLIVMARSFSLSANFNRFQYLSNLKFP